MNFSECEIEMARRFSELGLVWEPKAGHYVLDPTGFCRQTSPFQDRVYFILNYPYFMDRVGGVERFKQIMIWLPTYEDARRILRNLGVSDVEVADELFRRRAIQRGSERESLYEMILDELLVRVVATQASATC